MRDVAGEKPMLPLLGQPMIDWVLDALSAARGVGKVHVSVSGNTPGTASYLRKKGVSLIVTSGRGYCEDLNEAMSLIDATMVMVCPADLPLITPQGLEKVVAEARRSVVGSFCVTVPEELMRSLGMGLTYSLEVRGRKVVLCGVSVVDRMAMLTGKEVEQDYTVTEEEGFALNVNTIGDLQKAERALRRREH
jgi:adenosylcobinamide-phosphate guanylyltransferase